MVRGSKVGIVPPQAITSSSPSRGSGPCPAARRGPARGAPPGRGREPGRPLKCKDPARLPAACPSLWPPRRQDLGALDGKGGHSASNTEAAPREQTRGTRGHGASGQCSLSRSLAGSALRLPGLFLKGDFETPSASDAGLGGWAAGNPSALCLALAARGRARSGKNWGRGARLSGSGAHPEKNAAPTQLEGGKLWRRSHAGCSQTGPRRDFTTAVGLSKTSSS